MSKGQRIEIRIGQQQKDRIREIAHSNGESVTEWIMGAISLRESYDAFVNRGPTIDELRSWKEREREVRELAANGLCVGCGEERPNNISHSLGNEWDQLSREYFGGLICHRCAKDCEFGPYDPDLELAH